MAKARAERMTVGRPSPAPPNVCYFVVLIVEGFSGLFSTNTYESLKVKFTFSSVILMEGKPARKVTQPSLATLHREMAWQGFETRHTTLQFRSVFRKFQN